MSSLKDQILGCGCLILILAILCIASFVIGGYYGRDFMETVKEKTTGIYDSVVDKAKDVSGEVKDASSEIIEEASKKGKENIKEEVKESVNKYVDEK